jgi:predicted DNA repair protein MutK
VFGFDVRRAINATRPRRIASFGSMLVLVVLAILFGAVAPWWVWPVLVVCEGIVFLVLGNYWAAKDSHRRDQG